MSRILVVDDESAVRDLVALVLGEHHEVVAAPDADAALDQLHETTFDVVILDYALPGTTGDEVGYAIRLDYPDTRVLALSANASTFERDGWADIYLDKLEIVQLPDAVEELLGGRQGGPPAGTR